MATEKTIKSRIINKHETEANWSQSSFIPKKGEIIIYDADKITHYERIKIGDGIHTVSDALRFRQGDRY